MNELFEIPPTSKFGIKKTMKHSKFIYCQNYTYTFIKIEEFYISELFSFIIKGKNQLS